MAEQGVVSPTAALGSMLKASLLPGQNGGAKPTSYAASEYRDPTLPCVAPGAKVWGMSQSEMKSRADDVKAKIRALEAELLFLEPPPTLRLYHPEKALAVDLFEAIDAAGGESPKMGRAPSSGIPLDSASPLVSPSGAAEAKVVGSSGPQVVDAPLHAGNGDSQSGAAEKVETANVPQTFKSAWGLPAGTIQAAAAAAHRQAAQARREHLKAEQALLRGQGPVDDRHLRAVLVPGPEVYRPEYSGTSTEFTTTEDDSDDEAEEDGDEDEEDEEDGVAEGYAEEGDEGDDLEEDAGYFGDEDEDEDHGEEEEEEEDAVGAGNTRVPTTADMIALDKQIFEGGGRRASAGGRRRSSGTPKKEPPAEVGGSGRTGDDPEAAPLESGEALTAAATSPEDSTVQASGAVKPQPADPESTATSGSKTGIDSNSAAASTAPVGADTFAAATAPVPNAKVPKAIDLTNGILGTSLEDAEVSEEDEEGEGEQKGGRGADSDSGDDHTGTSGSSDDSKSKDQGSAGFKDKFPFESNLFVLARQFNFNRRVATNKDTVSIPCHVPYESSAHARHCCILTVCTPPSRSIAIRRLFTKRTTASRTRTSPSRSRTSGTGTERRRSCVFLLQFR